MEHSSPHAHREARAAHAEDEDRIQCLLCSQWFSVIGYSHLRCKHNMSVEEYKQKFGLDYVWSKSVRRRWRPENIERGLRAWCEMHGPLNYIEMNKTASIGLSQAALRTFGSLRKAAQAFNLPYRPQDPPSCGPRWSQEKIIRELCAWCETHGTLNSTRLKATNAPLARATYRTFGNLHKAANVLHLPYRAALRWRRWGPGEVERALRAWCQEHGPLNRTGLYETNNALYQATIRVFGKLSKAAAAHHLPYFALRRKWHKKGAHIGCTSPEAGECAATGRPVGSPAQMVQSI